jgi:5-methyltetrahydrofolate--homocysteine methyltransferase
VSAPDALAVVLGRLDAGRPVLLGADPVASFRARGVAADGPAPIGRMLRESPAHIRDHYGHEIAAGVDVLAALTSETVPRALGLVGMAFRAAALTGLAVDIAHDEAEAATRNVAVAGMLSARWFGPMQVDRVAEECSMHAARLAASDCDLLIAQGFGGETDRIPPGMAKLGRMAAVVSASATDKPTWCAVHLEAPDRAEGGEPLDACVRSVVDSGAHVVLLEVPSVDVGLGALAALAPAAADLGPALRLGAVLSDGERVADPIAAAETWAASAKRLLDAGALLIGGGHGTTARHVAALARLIGRADPASIWPRAV